MSLTKYCWKIFYKGDSCINMDRSLRWLLWRRKDSLVHYHHSLLCVYMLFLFLKSYLWKDKEESKESNQSYEEMLMKDREGKKTSPIFIFILFDICSLLNMQCDLLNKSFLNEINILSVSQYNKTEFSEIQPSLIMHL